MIDQEERARVRRLNRRWRNEGLRISIHKSSRALGRYIISNTNGVAEAWSDDLAAWEREEGIL